MRIFGYFGTSTNHCSARCWSCSWRLVVASSALLLASNSSAAMPTNAKELVYLRFLVSKFKTIPYKSYIKNKPALIKKVDCVPKSLHSDQVNAATAKEFMKIYSQKITTAQLPENDFAAALAFYLVSSYTAHHNSNFLDKNLVKLTKQGRKIIQSAAPLNKISPSQQRHLFCYLIMQGSRLLTMNAYAKKLPPEQSIDRLNLLRNAKNDAKNGYKYLLEQDIKQMHLKSGVLRLY